ncbi:MAG: RnfABCDGE type electron transport complex subunit A [Erysipelotrichaceae bacterium]|jgi:electron transport complex protein RnfA|nr:RnfABCDGE type electron transport complex subunit A [Bacillota bacterium]NLP21422.1 RnfABCDGE type electron transport complex subunit A [Erysipelotrichaceae bacterium]HCY06746.1 electron transport complex subunit RsxA [Erysipelotrichaceae bacterium]
MGEIFSMFIAAVLINNIVLAKFLGICPFLGVSNKLDSAFGMSLAVIFVIVGASIMSYGIYYMVLVPLGIEYMMLITFILVIATFVQFTEMVIKKYSPGLYKALGIYLPLITTNCVVLQVTLDNIANEFNFVNMLVYSFAVPIGFMLVLLLFATIRERLETSDIPEAFKGNPIALVVAAIMALTFSAFAGLV